MKSFSALFGILLLTLAADAQPAVAKLQFYLKNPRPDSIKIVQPLNNTIFWPASRNVAPDEQGTVTLQVDASHLGFLSASIAGHTIRVFLQKGDDLKVEIDTSANPVVQFKGSNAAGQALLSGDSLPFHEYYISEAFRKDSSLVLLSKHIDQEKKHTKAFFQQLYQQKKIDDQFRDFGFQWIDYLYATVASQSISNKFYSLIYSRNNISIGFQHFKKEYHDYWSGLFRQLPPNNAKALIVPTFNDYVQCYANDYALYLKWLSGDTTRENGDTYQRENILSVRKLLTGKVAENAEAQRLIYFFIQEQFEENLVALFDNFKATYPNSAYSSYIQPYQSKIIHFYEVAATNFNQDQRMVPQFEQISSIDSLKSRFRGKFFYMDIWATWCGPCKEEFRYKDSLMAFLASKNIALVYLSLDQDIADLKWKNMIKYFDLRGYHIRANDTLRDKVMSTFGERGGFTIPRYMLFDEKGRIIEENALRPSDTQELYLQITSHLSNSPRK